MINVYIEDNYIEIDGHAHYAEPGKDIVCAGVSTLYFTLIEGLEDCAITKHSYMAGHAECKFTPLNDRAKVVYETICKGLSLMAANYPNYVNVVKG